MSEREFRNFTTSDPGHASVFNEKVVLPGEELRKSFVAHSADNMYQIPTIVGTQIRINRLSDTNRLFFKLDADLTGDITISTDSGTTEKPLVDFDEKQITHLEKGFVEVVADADFFILRNRGISAADKQALIEIVNEGERNESDLKTQFIDAVNEVDTDGGINLPVDAPWAEILANVPNIKTGKKWASGETQSLPSQTKELLLSGLGFNPSYVFGYNDQRKNFMVSVEGSEWGEVGYARYDSFGGYSLTITTPEPGAILLSSAGSVYFGGVYKWIAFE